MTQQAAIPAYIYPDYGNPSGAWNRMIAAAAQTGFVVINPSDGPGSRLNSDYATQVYAAQAAGIKVIGYVRTNYTAFTEAIVEADIDSYYAWYNVDGIMVDEVTTAAGTQSYYQDLHDYIKGKPGAALVVLNPGTPPDESYMTACDICGTAELDLGNYRKRTAASWESSYAPDRFWHIIYACGWSDQPDGGLAQLREALTLSQSYGAGYVWITSDTEPNPYDTIPADPYWPAFISALGAAVAAPALEDGFDHAAGLLSSAWTTTGTATIASFQLQMTGHDTYADHLDSAATFDFTGASASIQALTVPAAPSGEAWLRVMESFGDFVAIGKSGSSLVCRVSVSRAVSDTTATWDAANMRYWRITFDGTTVTWQTSPDRATWANQRVLTTGLPALTSAALQVLAGHYDSPDPDELAAFKNVLVTA